VSKRLDRGGVMRIDCDVLHTWMSAVIVVVTTPHFAITDAKGRFVLTGLSPGSHRLEVWHERLGRRQSTVNLQENETFALEAVFSSSATR
jgi:hypothetical protein